jgi:hypothetical protein
MLSAPSPRRPRNISTMVCAKASLCHPQSPSSVPTSLGTLRITSRSPSALTEPTSCIFYLRVLCATCTLVWLHQADLVLPRRFLHPPLDPRQLFLRTRNRRLLLDTWSRHESMVKLVRIQGREPLRSASRRLGFAIVIYWGPGGRFPAGPTCVWRYSQDFVSGHLRLFTPLVPLVVRCLPDLVTDGFVSRSLSWGCA